MNSYIKKNVLIFIASAVAIATARAEYRAYQYLVTNKITSGNNINQNKIVISTLNPRSYVAYHGGTQIVNVELLRSWMCYGHTGSKKTICDSPLQKTLAPTGEVINE